jgi:tRNA pseudouridine38-40 synthase
MTPRHGVALVVAYDGTRFSGFQIQAGQRTVQAELERAIQPMSGHPVRVWPASRTDAGVHALGQVVAFDCERDIAPLGWKRGLDRHLPDDVRVQRAYACAVGYNPRFDSTAKTYRYVLGCGESEDPLQRHRAWHLGKLRGLDLSRMRRAARMLEGTHDYRAFRSADDPREKTERTLYRIDVHERFEGDRERLAIDVRGNGFMKNMVRILVGTLVDVARGQLELGRLERALGPEGERTMVGQTAPARGLVLLDVELGRPGYTPRG